MTALVLGIMTSWPQRKGADTSASDEKQMQNTMGVIAGSLVNATGILQKEHLGKSQAFFWVVSKWRWFSHRHFKMLMMSALDC